VESREARVARNEAISREINEGIELSHAPEVPHDVVRMVCECGRSECDRLLAISIGEYEAVRADPRRFVVVKAHVMTDVEFVVDENPRFTVVEKREGRPAEVAEALDPRA
jgi:hypothetical protein